MSKRTERRLKLGVLTFFVVAILIIAGLYVAPGFRLSMAQRLGMVPGADATRVAGPNEGRLIVISYPEKVQLSLDIYRQVARYIVRSGNQVTDLSNGQTFTLPIDNFSAAQVSADRQQLILQGDTQSALIDLNTDATTLIQGNADPGANKAFTRTDLCSGVSPENVYTLCIRVGGAHNTLYLWGNWEVMVRPYGHSGDWQRVYRGRGSVPIVGFAPDNKSVYIYNELGIWRAPIS